MTTQLSSTDTDATAASSPTGAVVAVLAGIGALAMAVYQLAVAGGPAGNRYETFVDYVGEAIFLLYLGASAAGAVLAHRSALAPRAVAILLPLGYGLIFAGVCAELAVRDSLGWFFLLAGPGQLMAMAGYVTWAVWGRRRNGFGWSLTLLCGIGGLVVIIGSAVGLSVLVAGFWFGLAALSRSPRTGQSRPTA